MAEDYPYEQVFGDGGKAGLFNSKGLQTEVGGASYLYAFKVEGEEKIQRRALKDYKQQRQHNEAKIMF